MSCLSHSTFLLLDRATTVISRIASSPCPLNIQYPALPLPVACTSQSLMATFVARLIPSYFEWSLIESLSPYHASLLPFLHEFASISAQIFSMCCRFFLATSRLCAVRSSRAARRHLFTSVFAFVHMPIDFQRNPRAWHSSSAVMSSSQPAPCQTSA